MKIEIQEEFNRLVIDGVIVNYAVLKELILDPDPCVLLQISRKGNEVTIRTVGVVDPRLVNGGSNVEYVN